MCYRNVLKLDRSLQIALEVDRCDHSVSENSSVSLLRSFSSSASRPPSPVSSSSSTASPMTFFLAFSSIFSLRNRRRFFLSAFMRASSCRFHRSRSCLRFSFIASLLRASASLSCCVKKALSCLNFSISETSFVSGERLGLGEPGGDGRVPEGGSEVAKAVRPSSSQEVGKQGWVRASWKAASAMVEAWDKGREAGKEAVMV